MVLLLLTFYVRILYPHALSHTLTHSVSHSLTYSLTDFHTLSFALIRVGPPRKRHHNLWARKTNPIISSTFYILVICATTWYIILVVFHRLYAVIIFITIVNNTAAITVIPLLTIRTESLYIFLYIAIHILKKWRCQCINTSILQSTLCRNDWHLLFFVFPFGLNTPANVFSPIV